MLKNCKVQWMKFFIDDIDRTKKFLDLQMNHVIIRNLLHEIVEESSCMTLKYEFQVY